MFVFADALNTNDSEFMLIFDIFATIFINVQNSCLNKYM